MSGSDIGEISVLIGGKAGDGINSAGLTIAHLFNHLGYQVYMYFDYPSLIKGGHNYSVIRASAEKIGAHKNRCDFLLALNQDAIGLHGDSITNQTVVIFDRTFVKGDGVGVAIAEILKAENAPSIMGNSCIIGAFGKAAGIEWTVIESVMKKQIPKGIGQNLKVARRGYDGSVEKRRILPLSGKKSPLLTGNEAIGLGLINGGLEAYIAYPMTPTTNLLHFLAESTDNLPLTVVHPENEIAVILMALGFAYAGKRSAVGTSGGGFCLMTEGFSLAGMSEVPVVVVMGQRTGPSTGLPTYTAQSDLHFVMHAGQGEFPRFIVAPGNLEQAYEWSSAALDIAWKYQIPAIILVDKTLCEGTYSFNDEKVKVPVIPPWPVTGETGPYHRYTLTGTGVSPMQSPPAEGSVIKVNSYAHDESGITTEKADMVKIMTEKRIKKGEILRAETELLKCVNVAGNPESATALLCWGSNLGVCSEVAGRLGIKVIQPVILCPFPEAPFKAAVKGVQTLIAVENSTCGQLPMLISRYGIRTDRQLLRYDGRPFSVDDLESAVREVR